METVYQISKQQQHRISKQIIDRYIYLTYFGSIFLKAEKSVLFGKVWDPVCPRSLARNCPLDVGGDWRDINSPPEGWIDENLDPEKLLIIILSPRNEITAHILFVFKY